MRILDQFRAKPEEMSDLEVKVVEAELERKAIATKSEDDKRQMRKVFFWLVVIVAMIALGAGGWLYISGTDKQALSSLWHFIGPLVGAVVGYLFPKPEGES